MTEAENTVTALLKTVTDSGMHAQINAALVKCLGHRDYPKKSMVQYYAEAFPEYVRAIPPALLKLTDKDIVENEYVNALESGGRSGYKGRFVSNVAKWFTQNHPADARVPLLRAYSYLGRLGEMPEQFATLSESSPAKTMACTGYITQLILGYTQLKAMGEDFGFPAEQLAKVEERINKLLDAKIPLFSEQDDPDQQFVRQQGINDVIASVLNSYEAGASVLIKQGYAKLLLPLAVESLKQLVRIDEKQLTTANQAFYNATTELSKQSIEGMQKFIADSTKTCNEILQSGKKTLNELTAFVDINLKTITQAFSESEDLALINKLRGLKIALKAGKKVTNQARTLLKQIEIMRTPGMALDSDAQVMNEKLVQLAKRLTSGLEHYHEQSKVITGYLPSADALFTAFESGKTGQAKPVNLSKLVADLEKHAQEVQRLNRAVHRSSMAVRQTKYINYKNAFILHDTRMHRYCDNLDKLEQEYQVLSQQFGQMLWHANLKSGDISADLIEQVTDKLQQVKQQLEKNKRIEVKARIKEYRQLAESYFSQIKSDLEDIAVAWNALHISQSDEVTQGLPGDYNELRTGVDKQRKHYLTVMKSLDSLQEVVGRNTVVLKDTGEDIEKTINYYKAYLPVTMVYPVEKVTAISNLQNRGLRFLLSKEPMLIPGGSMEIAQLGLKVGEDLIGLVKAKSLRPLKVDEVTLLEKAMKEHALISKLDSQVLSQSLFELPGRVLLGLQETDIALIQSWVDGEAVIEQVFPQWLASKDITLPAAALKASITDLSRLQLVKKHIQNPEIYRLLQRNPQITLRVDIADDGSATLPGDVKRNINALNMLMLKPNTDDKHIVSVFKGVFNGWETLTDKSAQEQFLEQFSAFNAVERVRLLRQYHTPETLRTAIGVDGSDLRDNFFHQLVGERKAYFTSLTPISDSSGNEDFISRLISGDVRAEVEHAIGLVSSTIAPPKGLRKVFTRRQQNDSVLSPDALATLQSMKKKLVQFNLALEKVLNNPGLLPEKDKAKHLAQARSLYEKTIMNYSVVYKTISDHKSARVAEVSKQQRKAKKAESNSVVIKPGVIPAQIVKVVDHRALDRFVKKYQSAHLGHCQFVNQNFQFDSDHNVTARTSLQKHKGFGFTKEVKLLEDALITSLGAGYVTLNNMVIGGSDPVLVLQTFIFAKALGAKPQLDDNQTLENLLDKVNALEINSRDHLSKTDVANLVTKKASEIRTSRKGRNIQKRIQQQSEKIEELLDRSITPNTH